MIPSKRESASNGRWTFSRTVANGPGGTIADAVHHDTHLLCVSAFTFAGAYRSSSVYARGLRWLSTAVASHLPGWVLRVYADASVFSTGTSSSVAGTSSSLLSSSDVSEWATTFSELECAPHVSIIWFEIEGLRAASGDGHIELTGCLSRFYTVFAGGRAGALPDWAAAPPDGRIVASVDADWGEYFSEHAMLHALSWLAAARAAPGSDEAPQLLGLAGAGSVALRHSPRVGALPPFYSGLFAARERLPCALLDAFVADAVATRMAGLSGGGGGSSSGGGSGGGSGGALLPRYLASLHAPASRASHTYARRAVAGQTCVPFGADEWFLTACLAPHAVAEPRARSWLFVSVPSVDSEVRPLLELVRAALARRPQSAASDAPSGDIADVLAAAAAAAGADAEADLAHTLAAAAASSPVNLPETLGRWASTWPKAAASRLSVWEPFAGSPALLDDSTPSAPAASVSSALRSGIAAALRAIATGVAPADDDDVRLFLQQSEALAAASPGLVAVAHVRVGAGVAARRPPDDALSSSLAQELRAGMATARCACPRPRPSADPGAVLRQRAVAPPPAIRAPESAPTGWSLCVSRTSGKKYWHKDGVSLWHDESLPSGWAWGQGAADKPRFWVELATGAQQDTPPRATQAPHDVADAPPAKRQRS